MNSKWFKFLSLLVIVALLVPQGTVFAAPTDITLSNSTLDENNAPGATVGTLSATGCTGTCTFTVGGADGASFGITENALTINDAANYEAKSSYVIEITATDSDDPGNPYMKLLMISIGNINEAPVITFSGTDPYNMSEDGSPTTWPGLTSELSAADPDNSPMTWSVSSAASHGTATVNGSGANPAVFTYVPTANYNGVDTFTVQVSDGVLSDTQVINVNVASVGDAPTDITLTSNTVTENAAVNTVIGAFSTADVDSGSTFTYSLETSGTTCNATNGADNGLVNIAANSLRVTGPLNFTVNPTLEICVQTTDSDVPANSLQKAFTVNVTQNHAPVIVFSGYVDPVTAYVMSEDGTPTVWSGQTTHLTASDADAGETATLEWSVSSAAAHGTATVSGTGANPTVFTYVPTANYNGADSFTVQVSDGTLTDTQVINVTVESVGDAPTDITLSANTVIESAEMDTVIGTFTTADVDTGSAFTYSLETSGTTCNAVIGDDNGLVTIVDNALQVNGALNSSANPTLHICVQVTDSDLPANTYQKAFFVMVTPNHAPVIGFNGYTDPVTAYVMSEDGAPTVWPGQTTHFAAFDADEGETATLVWSVSTPAAHGTATISGTGAVPTVFTYAPTANYAGPDSFTLQVSDGILTGTQVINVTVESVGDAPTDITLSASTVIESAAVDTVIGTFTTADVDTGSTFTYSLETSGTTCTAVNGADNGLVTIVDDALQVNGALNFAANPTLQICVQATDSDVPANTYQEAFVVTVNQNHAPVIVFSGYVDPVIAYVMSEDGAPTVWPGQTTHLTASDADAGETATLEWSVSSAATYGTATVSGTGANPAVFTYVPPANYYGPDIFTVQVTDGTLTDTQVINVTVESVADVSTDITLTSNTVAENAAVNTVIGALGNNDHDIADTFTYTLETSGATCNTTNGADNALVKIVGNDLQVNGTVNFETNPSLLICVQVADSSIPANTFQEALTLTVTNISEAPVITFLGPATYFMGEDGLVTAWSGSTGHLLAADQDEGDTPNLTWSVSTNASHGTTTVEGTGANPTAFTYTPNPHYAGHDSFTVQVSDGTYTDTQVILVNVLSVNDPPSFIYGTNIVAACNAGTVTEAGWATDIRPGPVEAVDESIQTLHFTLTNDTPALLTADPVIDPVTGNITFTPAGCENIGTATLTATLFDNATENNSFTPAGNFTIEIVPVYSISGTVSSNLTCPTAPTLGGGITAYLDEDNDSLRDPAEYYGYVNGLTGAYSITGIPVGSSGTLRLTHLKNGYTFTTAPLSDIITDLTDDAVIDFTATGTRSITGTITGPEGSRLPAGTVVDFGNCLTWTAPANGTNAETSFVLTNVPPKAMLLTPVLSGPAVAAISTSAVLPARIYTSPIVSNDTAGNVFTFKWTPYSMSGTVRTETGSKPLGKSMAVKMIGTGEFDGVKLSGTYTATTGSYKVVAPWKRVPGTNDPKPFTGNISLDLAGYEAYVYDQTGPFTMNANVVNNVIVYGDRSVYGEIGGATLPYGTVVDFGSGMTSEVESNFFMLSYLERKAYALKPTAAGFYFTNGATNYAQGAATVDLRIDDKYLNNKFFAWAVPKPVSPANGAVITPAIFARPTFTWEAVPGATGYTLEVSNSPYFKTGTGTASFAPGNVTTYTPATDLAFAAVNTRIYWRVKALGIAGAQFTNKFPALARSFTLQLPAPTLTSPINNAVVNGSAGVTFIWSAVSNLPAGAKYIVEYSTSSKFVPKTSRKIVAPATTWLETAIADRTTNVKYYWRVYAIDTAGRVITPMSATGTFLR